MFPEASIAARLIAAFALMMPHPSELFGESARLAVSRRISRTSIGAKPGFTCSILATTPATSGLAKDVPALERYSPGVATYTIDPGAETSGLIRPSAVGPKELNDARVESGRTAPTAITESPSAGVPM